MGCEPTGRLGRPSECLRVDLVKRWGPQMVLEQEEALHWLFCLMFICFGCVGALWPGHSSLVAAQGLLSNCLTQASHWGVCSVVEHRLGALASVVLAPRLQSVAQQSSGTGLAAQVVVGSSRIRVKHLSITVSGRFFAREPPGKPWLLFILFLIFFVCAGSAGQRDFSSLTRD